MYSWLVPSLEMERCLLVVKSVAGALFAMLWYVVGSLEWCCVWLLCVVVELFFVLPEQSFLERLTSAKKKFVNCRR